MKLKTNANNSEQGDLAEDKVSDVKQVENLEVHHHSCHSSCGCLEVEPNSFNIEFIVIEEVLND